MPGILDDGSFHHLQLQCSIASRYDPNLELVRSTNVGVIKEPIGFVRRESQKLPQFS